MALHDHSLAHRLCSGVLSETYHVIERALAALPEGRTSGSPPRLLDVGCWNGDATLRYAARIGAITAGIEIFPEPAAAAQSRGIDVASVDLETARFPWPPGTFDVVVANQVFEHLKNIWLPLSEVYRVLRPGGHFIISVPNLGSAHNRVLLALGRQPTSVRTFGPHVRGYTLSELRQLVTHGGGYEVTATHGVGFYPLPARWTRPLTTLWRGGSHTIVLVVRKIADLRVAPWDAFRQQENAAGEQTFYGISEPIRRT
jgi:SAM-dependent methyltransferase